MKITADGRIHYSHEASQPYVGIACGLEADTWEVLYPEHQINHPYGNPLSHGYTFEPKKVTCRDCLAWIKKQPKEKYRQPIRLIIKRLLCRHNWKVYPYIKMCWKCRKVKVKKAGEKRNYHVVVGEESPLRNNFRATGEK